MDLGIAGKHAVVTGGTAGLGLASCEALAAEGVRLTVFARNPEKLASTCASLEQRFGVKAEAAAGDMTRRADVTALADQLRRSGGVDILVLNTPRPPSPLRDFLDETEDARWTQGYQDQLHGALNVLRDITPLLRERGWGRIIGITSASIKQPMPRHALSTIFRAGVQAALKHLANDLAAEGITVNAIAPATIVTSSFEKNHDTKARVAAVPMKRAGTPAELGAMVAFIASMQAGFMTGQNIQLDGGMTSSLF